MFYKTVIATSVAVLYSVSAMAADAIVYNEPTPPEVEDSFIWTGGYIGVNAGYSWGKVKTELVQIHPCDCDEYEYNKKLNGFSGGAQLGYNWQINKALFGIETDIQGSNLKKNFDAVSPNFSLETKITWFGTTRLRVGYLPTERLLTYVTGGLAYGGVKAVTSEYWAEEPSSTSKTKTGYALGAGLEYALANNWTAKAEYLYTDLGSISQRVFTFTDTVHHDMTHKFRMNTVRVGLNYKF